MTGHPKSKPAPRDGVDARRRDLLTAAGLGGAGALAAAVVAPNAGEALEGAEEQIKGRYRLTPHVERFYFLNRL